MHGQGVGMGEWRDREQTQKDVNVGQEKKKRGGIINNESIKRTLTELKRKKTPQKIEKYELMVAVKRKRVNLGVM